MYKCGKQKLTLFLSLALSASILMTLGVAAQTVSRGFFSEEELERGTIVSIVPNTTSTVTIAKDTDDDNLLGVVVADTDSTLTLSNEQSNTLVSTTGRFEVLISDLNGSVLAGDPISVSAINGIGQKASSKQSKIVGTALVSQSLDPATAESTQEIDGKSASIYRVLAELGVEDNPDFGYDVSVPAFVRRVTTVISNAEVSPIRQYAAIIVLTGVLGVVGFMMYTAIKTSIIAVGRNPLSKKSINKHLVEVSLISFAILLAGLFTVYLLLR